MLGWPPCSWPYARADDGPGGVERQAVRRYRSGTAVVFRTVTGDTSDGVGSGFLDAFSLQGKDECGARPAIRRIDHLEVAAGPEGQSAGDAEAEARAVAAAGLEPREALEDAFALVRGDAWAVVADGRRQACSRSRGDAGRAVGVDAGLIRDEVDADVDGALTAVLERVVEQRPDDLLDPVAVGGCQPTGRGVAQVERLPASARGSPTPVARAAPAGRRRSPVGACPPPASRRSAAARPAARADRPARR